MMNYRFWSTTCNDDIIITADDYKKAISKFYILWNKAGYDLYQNISFDLFSSMEIHIDNISVNKVVGTLRPHSKKEFICESFAV